YIDYNELTNIEYYMHYFIDLADITYPYNVIFDKVPKKFAVTSIRITTDLGTIKQDFRYNALSFHSKGLGYLGFKRRFQTNWYDVANPQRIWTVFESDIIKGGQIVAQWSFREIQQPYILLDNGENCKRPTANLIGNFPYIRTSNVYDLNYSHTYLDYAVSSTGVKKTLPIYSYNYDFKTGKNVTTINQYDNNNNLIYTRSTNSLGYKSNTYTLENNYNANDANFYVGRLSQTLDTTIMYNNLYITQDNYAYTNGLLTSSIKKYNNNPQTLNTTMVYDVVGNITSSTSTVGEKSRTSSTIYDGNKRLTISKTDIDGKVTNFVNNDLGQQISITNYLNQTHTNTYNSWGKLLATTTNIHENNITNTINLHRLDNGGLTIETYNNIGGYKLETYDIASNLIKTKVKGFIENSYIEAETKYDVLGKKIKILEPYFLENSHTEITGYEYQQRNPQDNYYQNPEQTTEDLNWDYVEIPIYSKIITFPGTPEDQKIWTTINYDYLQRPINLTLANGKTITITYNGLTTTTNDGVKNTIVTLDENGNKVSVTDNNKTITYTYYANNQIKNSTIDGHILTFTYDDWGRKISQRDPSIDNNPYRYAYNEWGEQIVEYTPNNDSTKITYDNNGKITQKVSRGINTSQTINYTYDVNLFLTQETGTINYQTYTKTYQYDNKYRLISTTETTPYLVTQNNITYDNYGRLNTKNIFSHIRTNVYWNNGSKTIKYNY
ncbi:MAG: hypothetical protein ORN58_03570, partial [Sediminibacterium sp.]|nr:hypothetical protein [Sediminibacterium sp.]